MTRLILMRHGNTFEDWQKPVQAGARTDLPLTDFGKSQAAAMAAYLKNGPLDAIFAGSLKRQTESAAIIAKEFGLPVQSAPALTEIDYGLWEGLEAEEIAQKWPKEYALWSERGRWQDGIFKGTAQDCWLQIHLWFKDLRENFPKKTVLGVTSNGIFRFFRTEKIKTGHFCELDLDTPGYILLGAWNKAPS